MDESQEMNTVEIPLKEIPGILEFMSPQDKDNLIIHLIDRVTDKSDEDIKTKAMLLMDWLEISTKKDTKLKIEKELESLLL